MEQRLSVVTLGVADIARARSFYEALGWVASPASTADVAFFRSGGMVVALWDAAAQAADVGVDPAPPGAVGFAHNVRSPAEVDAVLEEARQAGGTVTRAGATTFWGGYSGAFTDPDGHPWEVAHNPGWPLDADGNVLLP